MASKTVLSAKVRSFFRGTSFTMVVENMATMMLYSLQVDILPITCVLRKVEELLAYVQSCCQAGVAVDIGQAAFSTSLNLLSNTFFSMDLLQPGSDNILEFKELVWNIMVELGTDTTSSTLEWAMVELLHNPDKLTKAKEELERVIGRGNLVREGDIARLLYLQSIVKEIFRLHRSAPFLVPRKVNADVELCGLRFLGSEMDVKGRDFELIPFGAGRRICPGMPLVIRMLQLMLGSLIHSFNWKLENGDKPENMDMDDKFGITLQKAQSLLVIPIQL
ncbi:hypothetical protein Nepgr_011306 [Nepenthes gracilis]|uniref:Cytochrome P450 n=1 Tax=Nepenthes gracilis TaxID=150966 RepID=A0AAD3XM74_NEPGR|nr:hypothetical protein Nepgr_011306 [Nepenthes gracilis]